MRSKKRPHEPIWDCFRYAFIGVWRGLKEERNLRIHFALGFLAAIAGVALGLSTIELVALTLIITLVIVVEMINTAFEATIDLVCPDHHPLAGYVKDVAAGAVLVASLGAIAIGALLFVPRLAHFISR